IYKVFDPGALSGIERKTLFALIPLGLLTLALWFPYSWVETRIKVLKDRQAHVIEQVIPIVIPLGLISYVLFMNVFGIEQIYKYKLDIGAPGDIDSQAEVYLWDQTGQGRISAAVFENNITYREILLEEPIYISLEPSIEIGSIEDIIVELGFKSETDLDMTTTDGDNYNWEVLYKKEMDNLALVTSFGEIGIYSDQRLNYPDYDNIDDWILNNIPTYSNISLYGYELGDNLLINKDVDYKNEITQINETIRGDVTFLVYLKDNLNLTLGKQDLNWYDGSDEYLVELLDMEDNIIFSDSISDDGITDSSNQSKQPQYKAFSADIPEEGLYTLKLTNLKGDQYTDSTITLVSINTNKIITTGTILPLSPCSLFFNLLEATTLNLYIWHTSAQQTVSITGTRNININLGESQLGRSIPINLPPGEYQLAVKGDINLSGTNFTFTEDSHFYPYNYNISDQDPSWMITDSFFVSKEDGWSTIKKTFNSSDIVTDGNNLVFALRKIGEGTVLIDSFDVTLKRK
ncbi:hypothetical protein ACFLW2_03600, partial [Chloroflexota bacterium]